MFRLRESALAMAISVAASAVAQAQECVTAPSAPQCACAGAPIDNSPDSLASCLFNCDCEEPFTLAGLMGLSEESRYKFGGHTAMGWYDNNVPLSQAQDDLLSFNDVSDKFQLNQQWVYFERVANNNGEWGLGGRIDFMYGVDAQKMQSFGNPDAGIREEGSFDASWDHGYYGFAMPQLYAEIANDKLSIKAGHFMTPLGYEVLPATGNFFYSHAYTMFNSEPFTHTGVLATYTGIENVTVYGGWSAGWDTGFDQLNSGSNWLGGFTLNLSENLAVTYLSTYGNFGWRDGGGDGSYSHAIVLTATLTEKLQYVAQSDYLRTDNPGISTFDTIGLNQYLFYSVTDWGKAGVRGEWWKADGVSFYEVSVGLNIKPLSNVVIRPEYRQDWAPGIGLDEDTFLVDCVLSY